MKKAFFACLSISFLAISCGKDDPQPNPASDSYMTISANSQWRYDVITNPGPSQTQTEDTVTASSNDTAINSRSYRIFNHASGAEDYYNISDHNYYRFQKVDLNGTLLQMEDNYLKDDQDVNTSWSENTVIPVTGFGDVPITVTNKITGKDLSKTVNGTAYTSVIEVTTTITSSALPGQITTDIKSYYAKKFGLIEGDYNVQISLAGIDIHTQTLLKSADIL